MTQDDKTKKDEQKAVDETIPETEDEATDVQEEEEVIGSDEVSVLKSTLARLQADYDNFKKRIERDKQDMMLYMRSDIFSAIIPRVDDLERILTNTPPESRDTPIYKGVEATYTALVKDLAKVGVVAFVSKGEKVDPEYHDVMSQAPGEEGIILDEFVKGYMIGERVLRHAGVVVGSGQ